MRAKVFLAALALACLLAAGCADRCDYTQTKCRYKCDRDYQVCELHGNDEFCRNEIAACTSSCEADHTTCRAGQWF